MSGYDSVKSNVLSGVWKVATDGADVTSGGRQFHTLVPATKNARRPNQAVAAERAKLVFSACVRTGKIRLDNKRTILLRTFLSKKNEVSSFPIWIMNSTKTACQNTLSVILSCRVGVVTTRRISVSIFLLSLAPQSTSYFFFRKNFYSPWKWSIKTNDWTILLLLLLLLLFKYLCLLTITSASKSAISSEFPSEDPVRSTKIRRQSKSIVCREIVPKPHKIPGPICDVSYCAWGEVLRYASRKANDAQCSLWHQIASASHEFHPRKLSFEWNSCTVPKRHKFARLLCHSQEPGLARDRLKFKVSEFQGQFRIRETPQTVTDSESRTTLTGTCKNVVYDGSCSAELTCWHFFSTSASWQQTTKCRVTASRQLRTVERSQSEVTCSTASPAQWTWPPKPTAATANNHNNSYQFYIFIYL